MALKVFNEMKTEKCRPNICTFTALINAFAREGLCEKAEEVFEELQDAGLEPYVYAYNALMEAYNRAGFPYATSEIFSLMQRMGCEPDRASYNIMVDAYGRAGLNEGYFFVHRYIRHISASVNEEASARLAADSAESGGPTIFDKIISKEIPSSIVYEDDKVLAFRDINPQAPVHVLVIPKVRDGLTQLGKAQTRHAEILGQLLYAAKVVADKEGIADGYRVVINNGPSACQSVYHLHLHVLGGRQMKWPPG